MSSSPDSATHPHDPQEGEPELMSTPVAHESTEDAIYAVLAEVRAQVRALQDEATRTVQGAMEELSAKRDELEAELQPLGFGIAKAQASIAELQDKAQIFRELAKVSNELVRKAEALESELDVLRLASGEVRVAVERTIEQVPAQIGAALQYSLSEMNERLVTLMQKEDVNNDKITAMGLRFAALQEAQERDRLDQSEAIGFNRHKLRQMERQDRIYKEAIKNMGQRMQLLMILCILAFVGTAGLAAWLFFFQP